MTNYNNKDKNSIIEYASQLKNKSLNDLISQDDSFQTYGGKGSFGQLLEKYYFGYEINSVSEPDFKDVGMELKSSPLKLSAKGEYKSKERLVLNIINYENIVNEEFLSSNFFKKNASILLIFYLYEKEKLPIDYIIKLVNEWNFENEDLEVIKSDWELIVNKIKDGKAHELSEGDTFYLGACTKGANANSVRKQPFSEILAKQRAFSFKQGYVNHIIAKISGKETGYGKLIESSSILQKQTVEEVILSKFEKYKGKSVQQIINETQVQLNPKAKNFTASFTKALLGIELDKKIEEFEKADIITKTVRLKENNMPKEDISFPNFKYKEIINEEWNDSEFKSILEHKFLFFFLKINGDDLIFETAKFWNMNYRDIEEAKKVWDRTIEIINNGEIVKFIDDKGRRHTNFPSKKFSSIAHVRPHGLNSNDTYDLPITDKLTGFTAYTKHCFWLNNSFIKNEIYLK